MKLKECYAEMISKRLEVEALLKAENNYNFKYLNYNSTRTPLCNNFKKRQKDICWTESLLPICGMGNLERYDILME